MPHGMFGLGWGEVVSLGTLIVVVLNYIKISVGELSGLLKQLNRDLATLTKRVNRHGDEIDEIKIDVAKIKERLGINDDENSK